MRKLPVILCFASLAWRAIAEAQAPIVFENSLFRYSISREAKNVAYVDRATGTDYLRTGPASPCALARVGGKEFPATAATMADGRFTLRFGESGISAIIKTDVR